MQKQKGVNLLKKIKRFFISLFCIAAAIFIAWLFLYNHDLPKRTNIDLSKAGNKAELQAKVNREDHFSVSFEFYKNIDENGKAIRDPELNIFLYGSDYIGSGNGGMVIPMKVTVYKINNHQKENILSKEYNTQSIHGWGPTIERKITDYNDLILPKGTYLIEAETLQDFEFFKDRKVDLVFKEYFVK